MDETLATSNPVGLGNMPTIGEEPEESDTDTENINANKDWLPRRSQLVGEALVN